MGTTTAKAASDKQIAFLTSLAAERVIAEPHKSGIARRLAARDLTSQDASRWITWLMGLPKVSKPAPTFTARTDPWADVQAALADVELSFYAVPAEYFAAIDEVDAHGNDLVFFRVRNMGKGRIRVSRVYGSVGGFGYIRLSPRASIAVANVIRGEHIRFSGLFAQHYSVCGRCGAELTDKESRDSGYGPTCRSIFGL